jgi:hypothetical protein
VTHERSAAIILSIPGDECADFTQRFGADLQRQGGAKRDAVAQLRGAADGGCARRLEACAELDGR